MEVKKIKLPFRIKKSVLSLGTQSKNTLCFGEGNFAYLSAVHQDLNNPDDFLGFAKGVRYFLKKHPKIIAYDLHPEYQSTKLALGLRAIPRLRSGQASYPSASLGTGALRAVQHHHAHIASCMADNGLKNQKVIGVAFDGTGKGRDNTLWGAEFLICDYKSFKRKAHLREIPLLGGERAIWEPWRLAAAWLYSIYKDNFLKLKINFAKDIDRSKWKTLKSMYAKGINAPLASSMGRLFDAAASLILAKYRVNFEAELARELEKIAISYKLEVISYKFKIIKDKDSFLLDPIPMFREIINDLKANEPKEKIAYKFHLTVAEMVKKMSLASRRETGINKVVLSGGVFQNNLLLGLSLGLLYEEGFRVFRHKNLSCNDSAVSLGQAVIAGCRS